MNARRLNLWITAAMWVALLCSCATRKPSRSALPAEAPFNREAGSRDWLYLTLRLDTQAELLFCVETGSPITVLDKSLGPVLGNRVGERTLHYVWKDVTGGRYKAPNLYLGKTRLKTGDHVWTDDFRRNPCWTNAAGQPVMGILGMDCLRNYCVQLDFKAPKARFLDSECLERAGLGRAFPLTVYPRGLSGYVAIHGTFTGTKGVRPLVDTDCLVDGILDPKEFQLELRAQKAAWTNHFTGRLGFQRYTAFFPRAKFVGETYSDLTLDRSPDLVVGGKTNHVNVIGLPFLARHLVTLDFPKKTVYLKRRDIEPMADQAPLP